MGGCDDLRVYFVSTLADDPVNEPFNDVHVRPFDIALHQGAEALLTARVSDGRLAGSIGRREEVVADTVQSGWVRKICQLNLTGALGIGLAGLGVYDSTVGCDGDALGLRGNRDLWLDRITITLSSPTGSAGSANRRCTAPLLR